MLEWVIGTLFPMIFREYLHICHTYLRLRYFFNITYSLKNTLWNEALVFLILILIAKELRNAVLFIEG